MNCKYCIDNECKFENFEEYENYSFCDECPHFAEEDEFIGYLEWLKNEDAKLRRENG